MEDGFDVVAVRVEHEGGVVAPGVLGTEAGRASVPPLRIAAACQRSTLTSSGAAKAMCAPVVTRSRPRWTSTAWSAKSSLVPPPEQDIGIAPFLWAGHLHAQRRSAGAGRWPTRRLGTTPVEATAIGDHCRRVLIDSAALTSCQAAQHLECNVRRDAQPGADCTLGLLQDDAGIQCLAKLSVLSARCLSFGAVGQQRDDDPVDRSVVHVPTGSGWRYGLRVAPERLMNDSVRADGLVLFRLRRQASSSPAICP